MIKSIKNKVFAMLCVAVMTLGIFAPGFMNIAHAEGLKRTVYVDVEKNVLGGDVIYEPIKVELDETATILDATKQAVGADNIRLKWGTYVEAFRDNETETNYPKDFTDKLNKISNGVIYDKNVSNQPIIQDSEFLSATEYNGISGWMFTVNDKTTDNNGKFCTSETKLSDISQNAVIRWEFSEAMGADLGLKNSAWIPTAINKEKGTYDWNSCVQLDALFTRVNKSDLIRAMADHKGHAAYGNALEVLETLEVSKDEIDSAISSLTSVNP